jgi:hypothetical protein
MEVDDGRAPAAERFAGEVKFAHVGSTSEQGVNGGAQCADSFAVDDADAQDALGTAGVQVIGHQGLHVAGTKGVEIEDAVNREFDGVL